MKLLERMKHYNFWVALTMAVIILFNTLQDAFGLKIDDQIINDVIMAILGIMVVLGFIQKDDYDFVDISKDKKSCSNDETEQAKKNVDENEQ